MRQAGIRLRTLWLAKLLGTSLGMAAFFVGYFHLLRHPAGIPFVMPVLAIDRWIEFSPVALPLYLSLWLYVSLAPALLVNPRELLACGLAAGGLAVIGLGIFRLWPTTVAPPEVDWSAHPMFSFLKTVDASGNACPSLHVAFAVFAAVWFDRILRDSGAGTGWHWVNWAWCLGILYSTIAVRQHVFLDVLAGGLLGAAVVSLGLYFLDATRRTRATA